MKEAKDDDHQRDVGKGEGLRLGAPPCNCGEFIDVSNQLEKSEGKVEYCLSRFGSPRQKAQGKNSSPSSSFEKNGECWDGGRNMKMQH